MWLVKICMLNEIYKFNFCEIKNEKKEVSNKKIIDSLHNICDIITTIDKRLYLSCSINDEGVLVI